MRLLIDDQRYDKPDLYDIPVCDMIIRRPERALQFLLDAYIDDRETYQQLEIWLDHDMGPEDDWGGANGADLAIKTNGYGILCLIERLYHESQAKPFAIYLVTDNASARQKMQLVIDKLYQN